MRILLLVSGGQVETLQISALVRSLVAGAPDAELTVACPPGAAALAGQLDGVSTVLPLPTLSRRWNLVGWIRDWMRVRGHRTDIAVLCTTEGRVRVLVYLAGIPRRIGPARGATSFLLSDHVVESAKDNPAGVWIRLAHLLGISAERHTPKFDPGEIARQRAMTTLHSTGIADGRLLVALAPGNGFSEGLPDPGATLWDGERWAHLANQLARRHGAGLVFVGTEEDEDAVAAASVDVGAEHADLAGALDLAGTAALIGLCDLLVSGDSPLLHLAAAVGTPTVGLFGPTNGRRRGPYGEEHRVIQAIPPPLQRRKRRSRLPVPRPEPLMRRIRVEDVLAAIEQTT